MADAAVGVMVGVEQRDTAEAEAARLRALVEEARRVLEPFASVEVNELYDDGDEVSWPFFYARQLRAARDLRDRLTTKAAVQADGTDVA